MRRPTHLSGFTLLEVLLALFILTIVGVMISAGINMIVRIHDHIENKARVISDLQLAMIIIEQDIQQIINRPFLDSAGHEHPAVVVSDDYIEFTRSGWINPFSMNRRSTLQRVAYFLEDDNLIRITWNVLDRAAETKIESQLLLNNVKSFHVQVLPEDNVITNPSTQNLPLAYASIGIEVGIDIGELGYVKRLVPMAATTFSENTDVA